MNNTFIHSMPNNNVNISINKNQLSSIFQSNNFIPQTIVNGSSYNSSNNNYNNINNNGYNPIHTVNNKHKSFLTDEIDEEFLP